ncbi:alkaline phosphatase [Virgibacillus halodenitrificans]|uniref:alkaline phosphatase n=1 Tax=Virgibacillus halodenitrificans TaxID=1482 RepID=UPI00045C9CC8|nr:alkaline phosphatase [Virgibacillus halodenitrificans]MEC2159353.1 alkaline phosphatase [Virgibacillus halodenitrificans]CDQ36748.1 Alkaline phosphatase 3 precursor [Virgibacillus halodenitrificans]
MRKKLWIIATIFVLAIGSLLAMNGEATGAKKGKDNNTSQNNGKVKNVIVMIGDGMGPSYPTAYRYMKDDPSTPQMEKTVFDKHLVGMATTYADDPEENITDSAAAATSMSAGIKTYNGAIAVDTERSEVETVLEAAKKKGKSTGLVATSQINHATPAAFGAHDESRRNYNEIADDYFDEMINGEHKVDIMLGGGTDYFDREDRDLIEEFEEDGYNYVDDREEMLENENDKLLGLFAPVGLPKAIDREDSPSLEEMTTTALEQLSKNKDGFFLMVEGSQIDWAGHANDSVSAMSEMEDFAKAFETVIEFAKKDKHTQVVLTADHSTGGFSIGRDGEYNMYPEVIKAAERTPEFMAEEIMDGEEVEEVLDEYADLDFTEEEISAIQQAAETEDFDTVYAAVSEVFNVRAGIGFTTSGHTGVDVPVYAYGPKSEVFSGLVDNTDIANEVFNFLK